ncbi:SMODS-associated NUDIX domain-containing protein [Puia dinghuensis]|uniref:CD-NTase-associated protein 16 NUDIX domain-containing protein n=1 Tax=Puia dinghuensis TaxID=1792502 RepID=A0A8J2XWE5_9BACT|nr:hypothetical protein [Puia dinghuensis]GGB23382.1 hypothetical protein GCM10011511_54060 [Puia dinghuensis]
MKKNQAKFLVCIAAIIYLLIIWIARLPTKDYQPEIAVGIVIPFVIEAIAKLLENAAIFKTYLLSQTLYRGYEVRFSVAYLFNIRMDNEYLLIYNPRRQHFQPVGGVYKKFPEANVRLEKLEAKPDDLTGNDDIRKDDLRLFLPMSNAIRFVRWFKSEKDRETSPCREFYEELIRPGILAQQPFLYLSFKKRCTFTTPIQSRESNGRKYKQIQIFDVFDLLPNEEQKQALSQLRLRGHEDIRWASEELIKNGGYSFNPLPATIVMHIGEHTKWVLCPARR